jgi:mannose-6-phosphate isomerase
MPGLYPLPIEPKYDERIWGGHNLAERLGKDAPVDECIGESWEVYEENRVLNGPLAGHTIGDLRKELGPDLMGRVPADQVFPMLTKLIDAQQALSVQVHPDDRYARERLHQPYGKTECWYILDAEPDAYLIYGFNRDMSPGEYERMVREGTLEQVLRRLPVRAGDVVYLPARTVHAIGAGIILFELQQTSDVTYRIYDWNRRDAQGKVRELHVQEAMGVLDYRRSPRGTVRTLGAWDGRTMLVAGLYFCLELVEVTGEMTIPTYDSPVAICALEHSLTITAGSGSQTVRAYSSALVPACVETYSLAPGVDAGVSALIAYVPASSSAIRAELLQRGYPEHTVDDFLAQFD